MKGFLVLGRFSMEDFPFGLFETQAQAQAFVGKVSKDAALFDRLVTRCAEAFNVDPSVFYCFAVVQVGDCGPIGDACIAPRCDDDAIAERGRQ